MLKIKDNVDLKELEKYGFEKGIRHDKIATIYINTEKIINIVSSDRCWWDFEYYYNFNSETDVIYDLIKDGLVEKVED